jgi:hypothetical protein
MPGTIPFTHLISDARTKMRLSYWKMKTTSTCTRVEYSGCKNMTKLMNHADKDMVDFGRGMRSEVSWDCNNAAAENEREIRKWQKREV